MIRSALTYSLLSLLSLSYMVGANLIILDNNALNLRSLDFDYPNNEKSLDVIWLFNHSIRLQINEFHVNGHRGDFVFISDLPLLNSEYFKGINATEDNNYLEELARSIVTDQGLLLSWKAKKTIEAVSDRGTFVLFHAEAKDPTSTAQFKGFDIDVVNYDDAITTTTSTTPVPFIPPKDQETYITKVLNCKKPLEFLNELEFFKGNISALATKYCTEFEIENCLSRGNISKDEINIPDAKEGTYAGLHYCDRTWENTEECVEVTFSITRTDSEGNHVLPKDRLEHMWSRMSHELKKFGYCPYDPPVASIDLNTVVWIAFFLGIVFGLTALLGVAWIKNTNAVLAYRRSFMKDSEGNVEKMAVAEEKSQQKRIDERNPIYEFIPKFHSRDDHLYPSGDYLRVDESGVSSPGPFKKRSTENPTFQNTEVDIYAYDNTGFEEDQNEAHLSPRTDNDEDKLVMRSRTSRASLSDTEI